MVVAMTAAMLLRGVESSSLHTVTVVCGGQMPILSTWDWVLPSSSGISREGH
jgi:hypothetical protein